MDRNWNKINAAFQLVTKLGKKNHESKGLCVDWIGVAVHGQFSLISGL